MVLEKLAKVGYHDITKGMKELIGSEWLFDYYLLAKIIMNIKLIVYYINFICIITKCMFF